MNLSMKWLNQFVKADMPIREFTEAMTMSGSKVETYETQGEKISKIVVGKCTAIEKHADSEKLWICKIDVGTGEDIQIVTAAQNVYAGAILPVALHKSTLADGTKITKGKLRGAESNGMLCSFAELGMTQEDFPYADADGILILNADPDIERMKIGMDIREAVGFNDTSVEFEITNNRPDCLSVIGLAREAAATFNTDLNVEKPTFKGVDGKISDYLSVKIENTDLCSRYMGAVVKNVKIAPSPRWLAERLSASGVRPINNFVDITNYVMLEYGHPMHAFDLRYVDGGKIIVRNAVAGEKITILDGSEVTLAPEYLVIADEKKPVAIAGIMGGEYSGIMDDTTTVVFEAACFDGVNVRSTSVKINKRTDASSRFEKGLDALNAENAMYRALQLVEELGCGEVIREIIDENHYKGETITIAHDHKWTSEFLGVEIPENQQIEILERLGFGYDRATKVVTVPSVRTDMHHKYDIAEEIARIYGYNKIPSTLPRLSTQGGKSDEQKLKEKLTNVLIANGAYEVETYSFISPKAYEKISLAENERESVKIRNPFGEDTSVMRTSIIPSILDVIARNTSNRILSGRVFEINKVFKLIEGSLPEESDVLCIGYFGESEDFYTLKATVENVFEQFFITASYTADKNDATFHPGKCAGIKVGDKVIGKIGEIHPTVAENYNIPVKTVLAVIPVSAIGECKGAEPVYKPLPRFPAVTRDLSLLCDEKVTSGEIIDIIKKNAQYLEQVTLFDIFRHEKLGEQKKSLSYKLVFRSESATLTDNVTDEIITNVLSALEKSDISIRK